MALDITVNLTQTQSYGAASFGVPLFAAAGLEKPVEFTECRSLSDVTALGFDASSDLYAAVSLMRKQNKAPAKFAVYGTTSEGLAGDLAALDDKDWRQLVAVNPGTSTVAEIAAETETMTRKMFFTSATVDGYDTMEYADFKTAWEAVISPLKAYERTIVMFYSDEIKTPEAALVGASAGKDVGSFTYKNLILKGVPALTIPDIKLAVINGSDDTGCALTVVKKAGDIVTSEGKVASGEYIDVIDSRDWIIYYIGYEGQKVLNLSDKVPYTSVGITQLENSTMGVLKRAFMNGMIAPSDDDETVGNYTTSFAPRTEMSDSDISSRVYTGGNFTFVLAGAIHEAVINGEMTI